VFNWALPPLPKGPDLLILATELAGIGGTDPPLEVSATDSFPRSPTPPSAAWPSCRASVSLPARSSARSRCATLTPAWGPPHPLENAEG
jgi:hypothetical protein